MSHRFDIRVYWEDTDAGGVVYYANYLNFAERARTEALRDAGLGQTDIQKSHDLVFAVRHCDIDFLRPARLDDLLTIETQVEEIGNASLSLEQTIMRGGEKLAELKVRLAAVGSDFKPARIPAGLAETLRAAFHVTHEEQRITSKHKG